MLITLKICTVLIINESILLLFYVLWQVVANFSAVIPFIFFCIKRMADLIEKFRKLTY